MATIRNVRCWIGRMPAAATALSYLDRQSLPILVNEVGTEIPISDADYARLTSAFLVAYGLM